MKITSASYTFFAGTVEVSTDHIAEGKAVIVKLNGRVFAEFLAEDLNNGADCVRAEAVTLLFQFCGARPSNSDVRDFVDELTRFA